MKKYLLWSNGHEYWVKPASAGYTEHVDQAGRFTLEECEAVLKQDNRELVRLGAPEVSIVVAPEFNK